MLTIDDIIEHALMQGDVMVTRHDANGDYQHVYGDSVGVAGRKAKTMIGKPAYPWIHPDDRSVIARHHEGILLEKMHGTWVRYRKILPDGSLRWLESQTRKGTDPNSGRIELVVVTRRCDAQTEASIIDERGNRINLD